MVLETGEMLGEVTESVEYYVQGSTIAAGNLFGRRRVIQVYANGARILDGPYMSQELTLGASSTESGSASENLVVSAVSIADPFVLLKMSDNSILLLVEGNGNNGRYKARVQFLTRRKWYDYSSGFLFKPIFLGNNYPYPNTFNETRGRESQPIISVTVSE